MNNELKVSFYLKREGSTERTEVNPDALYPVIGKIIIGNSIAQFSSKLKIEERLWSVKSGRATGKSRVAVELNREINKINLSIHTHYRAILERTGTVTAQEVKNAFQGIATAQKTLLTLFDEMMQDFQTRIGIDRSQATYHKYVTIRKQVKRFLKVKYNVQDIPVNQLDLTFIEAFDFHLRVERKMTDETVSGTMLVLFKVVRIALHRKLIINPPFFGYKLKKPDFKIRSLTKEEFQRLISTPIESKSQCFIRDMFVFAAFTGLPYIDLKQLTWKEIITEEDGSLWISTDRQKTGIPFNVKLLDIPVQIIEKYKGLAKGENVFPMLGPGRINYALKIIAKLCNITTKLSFHVGRHVFASELCLSQGVPIESVSRMMGHKNIQTTQRYARVNNEKIGNDMKLLSLRISDKYTYVEQ